MQQHRDVVVAGARAPSEFRLGLVTHLRRASVGSEEKQVDLAIDRANHRCGLHARGPGQMSEMNSRPAGRYRIVDGKCSDGTTAHRYDGDHGGE